MVEKIRIKLKAYDHTLLDCSCKTIVERVRKTGARLAGPVPLPVDRSLYTVLKSPHIDKKSREQFEIRVHKRLLDIYEPTERTMEVLRKLSLPAGVDVEIKV
ncbi:30S ribosomal protein S10 [candidate division WOR-3 bacterium]|nr:30S ribosomal protein S10 [candidate division WOR-3 bacterium]